MLMSPITQYLEREEFFFPLYFFLCRCIFFFSVLNNICFVGPMCLPRSCLLGFGIRDLESEICSLKLILLYMKVISLGALMSPVFASILEGSSFR
ncbi:hypothetical protein CsSME_00001268 [Camellia sinensis var. sinensis]